MTTKTERAATHDGHCQVCGSRQRLPKGKLAKHGYTTRWGFFSGTCYGSEALPFEQDKSLVDEAIKRAQDQRTSLKTFAATLRDRTSEVNLLTTAWVHVYVAGSNELPARHVWQERQVLTLDGRNYTYEVKPGDVAAARGRTTERLDFYYPSVPTTIEQAVFLLNEKRAEDLDRTVKQISQYIKWQQERIANWTVQPLELRNDGVKPLTSPLTAAERTALEALRGNGLPGSKLEAAFGADWKQIGLRLRTERLARWFRGYLVITPKGYTILTEGK